MKAKTEVIFREIKRACMDGKQPDIMLSNGSRHRIALVGSDAHVFHFETPGGAVIVIEHDELVGAIIPAAPPAYTFLREAR